MWCMRTVHWIIYEVCFTRKSQDYRQTVLKALSVRLWLIYSAQVYAGQPLAGLLFRHLPGSASVYALSQSSQKPIICNIAENPVQTLNISLPTYT